MKKLIFCLSILSFSAIADDMFLAKFQTLNPQVNGTIGGSSTIYFQGEKVIVYNRLFAGAPEAWHMQNVYTGSRCPTAKDDINLDGIIDIQEANSVVGNILLPFDSDINSQLSGYRTFPMGDLFGTYFYEQEAWFNNLMNDLRAPDPDLNDNIVKLPRNGKFNPEGKVVMVYGITEHYAQLPETVASSEEYPAWKTIPVACGVFTKLYP
jgi:hypothetical protein